MFRSKKSHLVGGFLVLLSLWLGACQGAEIDAGTVDAGTVDAGTIDVERVRIPGQLGEVHQRFQGSSGAPLVILVGETHANLGVQRRVADLLGYLRAAYGVRVVGVEGLAASRALPLPAVAGSLDARRAAARAELLGRHLNGVEAAALADPELRVVGVSDMDAYTRHGVELERRAEEQGRQWQEDFERLLRETLPRLPLTDRETAELVGVFERFEQDQDGQAFLDSLGRLLEPYPEARGQLAELVEPKTGADGCGDVEDDPLMRERDLRLTENALRLGGDGDGASPVALVVGRCHLQGLHQQLAANGVPHLSVVVHGADGALSEPGDLETYTRWKNNTPTPFEEWLAHHKPAPQLERQTERDKLTLLNALLDADTQLRQGRNLDAIQALHAALPLPSHFRLERRFTIENGACLVFWWAGKVGYLYLSSHPFPDAEFPGYEVEPGEAGGFHYLLVGDAGGGDRLPPIPPAPPGGSSYPGEPPPGEPFRGLVERQEKGNPGSVSIFLTRRGDLYHRWVGAGPWIPLLTPADEVERQAEAFRDAETDADRILAARKVAESLLVDLDDDFFDGRERVYQVLDPALPTDLPLPLIAELADQGPGSLRETPELYSTPLPADPAELEPALTREPPGASLDRTAVWIDDSLRGSAGYGALGDALRARGVGLNQAPSPGATLLLLGAGEGWTVTLDDGRRVTGATADFHALLGADGELVAVNAEVAAESVGRLHDWRVAEERGLAEVEELIGEIGEREGQPFDRIRRDRARRQQENERRLAGASEGAIALLVEQRKPTILAPTASS